MASPSIPSALQPFLRPAWVPLTVAEDGSRDASKFAGLPWLAADESWPTCPNCQEPMALFVQLNLQTLPPELGDRWGTGLLQLFYCTNDEVGCECDCDGWEPFSQVHLLRLIEPQGEPSAIEVSPAPFPVQQITGWQPVEDYPSWVESTELEIPLTEAEWDSLEALKVPHAGDKLGGWPFWVQGVEYPDCPVCGTPMELVFQIDSEDHIPYMFGDVGCGHVTQCPTHKDQLGFGWACG